jgi:hypothetical protein
MYLKGGTYSKICSENPAAWQCHSAALHTTDFSRVLTIEIDTLE